MMYMYKCTRHHLARKNDYMTVKSLMSSFQSALFDTNVKPEALALVSCKTLW